MKIEVTKIIFDESEYDRDSYKINSINHCCEKLKHNKYIEFNYEYPQGYCDDCDKVDCNNCSNINYDSDKTLAMMLRYDNTYPEPWEDYYTTDTYFYPISYCPFCGEKIEVEVVNEIDLHDVYKKIEKEIEQINKKYRKTDSIKKQNAYSKQVNELNNIINSFYYINDYNEFMESIKPFMEEKKEEE